MSGSLSPSQSLICWAESSGPERNGIFGDFLARDLAPGRPLGTGFLDGHFRKADLALASSTVPLPPAGVAQLQAGERVGYRGRRQAQGAPLAGGKAHKVSREAAQDGDLAAGPVA